MDKSDQKHIYDRNFPREYLFCDNFDVRNRSFARQIIYVRIYRKTNKKKLCTKQSFCYKITTPLETFLSLACFRKIATLFILLDSKINNHFQASNAKRINTRRKIFEQGYTLYTALQKHESTLLNTYVLNEFLQPNVHTKQNILKKLL